MKKKALLIMLVSLFLLVIGTGTIVFGSKVKNNVIDELIESSKQIAESDVLDEEGDFFRVALLGEIETLSNKHGYEVSECEYNDEVCFIYNAECYELPIQYEFIANSDELGFLKEMICRYEPYSEKIATRESAPATYTGAELKLEVEKFIHMIEQVFEVNIGDAFYIVTSEGEVISNQEAISYEKVIAGEASVSLTLRDSIGFFWRLTSEVNEEGVIALVFTNYYGQYSDNITDVTVG